MPVETIPDFIGCDLSMMMPFAPISLAFFLSGSIASPRVRTLYFPGNALQEIIKEAVGIHDPLTRSLFGGGILRRFLRRVSLAKPTSAPLRF
jgi:hypothetical protein